jgi:thiol-disulfide isomerase/thioredoxin
VLVDFWTYSCVNCVRTLPYLRAWYEAYKDKGLVIVGVHSPEFEFEKVSANVSRAMGDLGVTWPVVQDNDYAQWTSYQNKYWPAHYFIDAKGSVRYFHFGEGGYETSERVIQALLKEAGADTAGIVSKPAPVLADLTPETYLGYERGQGFSSAVQAEAGKVLDYKPGALSAAGQWSLEGRWTITSQYIVPESAGTLNFSFNAKDVFLVVEPQAPGGSISVTVDGRSPSDTPDVSGGILKATGSRLYHLVKLESGGGHLLKLAVKGKLRLFAFTFG